MLKVLALFSTFSIFILILIWPTMALGFELVGTPLITMIIIWTGFQGGTTFSAFLLLLYAMIVFMIRKQRWPFRFTRIEWLVFGISIFMLISLRYTNAPEYGREKTFRFIATCVILLVSTRFFIFDVNTLKQTLKVCGYCAIGVVCLFLVLFITARDMLVQDGRFGPEGMSLIFGYTSAAAIVLMMYLVIGKTRLPVKIMAVIAMIMAMVVVVASGSRGPFLGLLIGSILAFLSVRSMIPSLISLVLIGMITFFTLNYLAPDEGKERITQGLHKDALVESGRVDLYRMGIMHYLNNPVWGGGVGSFAPVSGKGDERSYPHNSAIEIASEVGTIPLILFLLVIWFCLKSILLLRLKMPEIALEGKIIQFLFWLGFINSMVSFDLPDQRILFGAIGFLAAMPNLYRQSQECQLYEQMEYDEYYQTNFLASR